MNSIRQLMDQGVAPMRTTYWGKDVPGANCNCQIKSGDQNVAMSYNNIYGTITNTHAEAVPKGVLITGSLISNPKEWTKFIERKMYLGVEFPMPFIEWIETMGYHTTLAVVNGQVALEVLPITPEEINQ